MRARAPPGRSPLLLLVAGVIGMIVAATIRVRDPQRYERIGNRTAAEQVA